MTYNLNDGDGRQAVHQNDLLNRWQFSVKSGCAVSINTGTLGAADTLTVASGAVIHAGTGVSVSGQSVQIDAADASLPRKDLVYIDTNGDAQVAKGTPEAKRPTDPNFTGVDTYRPAPPDLSATAAVVLAEVWVAAGASSIDSGDLTNRRVDADLALRDLDAEQLSGDGVADGNTITDLVGQGLEVASGALRVLTSIYDGANIVAPVDNASVATGELASGVSWSSISTGSTTSLFGFDDGSNNIYEGLAQFTDGVSTSAKTILSRQLLANGGLATIVGSNGDQRFVDVVIVGFFDGVSAVQKFDAAGTPPSRTYSISSGNLQLAMGSGTFKTAVTMKAMRPGV